ncbi:MAG: TolC family protein [Bacteroidales bacterium]|nr:TolC family protein [Bacteroidales bacterium]
MKKLVYIALGMLLATTSCGLHKEYTSNVKVDNHLFGDSVQIDTLDTANIAAIPWKEFYTDPKLQALISHALDNNKDLAISLKNIDKAQASLTASRMAYLPTFAFSPSAGVNKIGDNRLHNYTMPITAQWELDIFGSITNRKQQAKVALEQAYDEVKAVKTALISNVASAYYDLVMLDRQVEISRETIDLWENGLGMMKSLFESGHYYSTALTQQEASIEGLRINLLNLQDDIRKTENALCLLMGDTPHAIERGSFQDFAMPEVVKVGVPAQLLQNRPDVHSAERAIAMAFYGVQGAKAEFYPHVTLSGSLGWGTEAANPAKFLMSFVSSLFQPLFQGGKLRANLKISEAQLEQAQIGFYKALLTAGNEVVNALQDCQMTEKKHSHVKKQLECYTKAFNDTKDLMKNGKASYLEVIRTQESLLYGQFSEVENRTNAITSLIALYTALGGGK